MIKISRFINEMLSQSKVLIFSNLAFLIYHPLSLLSMDKTTLNLFTKQHYSYIRTLNYSTIFKGFFTKNKNHRFLASTEIG